MSAAGGAQLHFLVKEHVEAHGFPAPPDPAPTSRGLRAVSNLNDLVCQIVGLRLNPDSFTPQKAKELHAFVRAYVGQIR